MQIQGLSLIQMEIADQLWSMDSEQDVQLWIQSLPTKRLRQMAISIYNLILIEAIDEELDFDDMSLANEVIEMVK
jgi:hypothetical protein